MCLRAAEWLRADGLARANTPAALDAESRSRAPRGGLGWRATEGRAEASGASEADSGGSRAWRRNVAVEDRPGDGMVGMGSAEVAPPAHAQRYCVATSLMA